MAFTPKLLQQGAGGGLAKNYIEDVFSTNLYTGTGATQTINNGIDLSGKGGLVWIKSRSSFSATEAQQPYHFLSDTTKTSRSFLSSNTTNPLASNLTISSFNSNGFSLDDQPDGASYGGRGNLSGVTYASWTFRKQPKFFDVVTYTGTGSTRTVAHNLGSVPGCIIIKNLSDTDGWLVYHRSIGATKTLGLNSSGAAVTDGNTYFNNTEPTSTVFTVKEGGKANQNGNNYVAYLFAHDAGGFGLTGTDNVVSCGSFTTVSNAATVNLGYEPQWVLTKRTDTTGSWEIIDSMRGFTVTTNDAILYPETSQAEQATQGLEPTSNGFSCSGYPNAPFIYIAIRRGPMKVPTVGTSVYNAIARTGTGAAVDVTGVGFAPDTVLTKQRQANDNGSHPWYDKIRGVKAGLLSTSTATERTTDVAITAFLNDGVKLGNGTGDGATWSNASGYAYIKHFFRRAPGFFDIVPYSGSGTVGQVINHNLGVVPELAICMCRLIPPSYSQDHHYVYVASRGINATLALNSTTYNGTSIGMFSATPTATQLTLRNVGGDGLSINAVNGASLGQYVMYLFATLAGVSKVGNYTGTGTTKQIDCGFTSGARFVLIKRTDSTGDWYVWDTARGIIAGNDPYLLLNSSAAETTNTDYIDTYSAGFELSSTAPAAINANGGTYIFLAIA
jgi:hypothetical protein